MKCYTILKIFFTPANFSKIIPGYEKQKIIARLKKKTKKKKKGSATFRTLNCLLHKKKIYTIFTQLSEILHDPGSRGSPLIPTLVGLSVGRSTLLILKKRVEKKGHKFVKSYVYFSFA